MTEASELIWLALRNITADWGKAAHHWKEAMLRMSRSLALVMPRTQNYGQTPSGVRPLRHSFYSRLRLHFRLLSSSEKISGPENKTI
jgi:hypothetical protein